jgi:multidrug efflux pump subunit AcrB
VVVDDAIVVIEALQEMEEEHLSALKKLTKKSDA